jgi:hypothetical protein
MTSLHRRFGSGHHQQPLHSFRPLWPDRRRGSDGARADFSQARLGRTRSAGDLGEHLPGDQGRHGKGRGFQNRLSPSVSPTSVKPLWYGTRKPANRYYNAIVWQCTRTDRICRALSQEGGQDRFREKPDCPWPPIFPGQKSNGYLDNVSEARAAADNGRAMFGTIESWIIWQLTGGVAGGAHVSDVSNASRTLLMDLETLSWDDEILTVMGFPEADAAAYRPFH